MMQAGPIQQSFKSWHHISDCPQNVRHQELRFEKCEVMQKSSSSCFVAGCTKHASVRDGGQVWKTSSLRFPALTELASPS